MNIKKIEKLTIGKEDYSITNISKNAMLGGSSFFNFFKKYFISKFSLIIQITDYSGNSFFYYVKPRRDCFKIKGDTYIIRDEAIKKTNTKYNMICYNEGNPEPKILIHESNEIATGRQLSNFMDSEIVDMVLRYKRKGKIDLMIILVIVGAVFVMILLVLHLLGIIDVVSFFMPRG